MRSGSSNAEKSLVSVVPWLRSVDPEPSQGGAGELNPGRPLSG